MKLIVHLYYKNAIGQHMWAISRKSATSARFLVLA